MQTTMSPAAKKHWTTPAITAIRSANTAEQAGIVKGSDNTEVLGLLFGPTS